MNFICDKDKCTGCAACANKCAKNAITMEKDEHGFDHPIIDDRKCVDCKMCVKVCPVNNPCNVERSEQQVYAARSFNKELKKKAVRAHCLLKCLKSFSLRAVL